MEALRTSPLLEGAWDGGCAVCSCPVLVGEGRPGFWTIECRA